MASGLIRLALRCALRVIACVSGLESTAPLGAKTGLGRELLDRGQSLVKGFDSLRVHPLYSAVLSRDV